ncbi:MAG TPA: porin [Acidobacteriota bacterium]|nr:porin [Acidobacteriota bacterium]
MNHKTLLTLIAACAIVGANTSAAMAADKEIKYGGRIQSDWTTVEGDDALNAAFSDFEDGTEFRRARLFVSGTLYQHVSFKAQYDFAGGDAEFKDVFIGLDGIPVVGHLHVGHFKEPFGLEELTSSKYITFLERSLTSAFVPSRNSGIGMHNSFAHEHVTFSAGVFRNTDNFGESTGDHDRNFTARATAVPWQDAENGNLVHIGAAFSHRRPNDSEVSYSQRPSVHLAPKFVSTGDIAADAANLVGGEFAAVIGPVPIQTEYIRVFCDAEEMGDPDFGAFYVQAGVFLTGEHRKYDASDGAFGRTKPRSNFFTDDAKGTGAWEIAARYSKIDLDDKGTNGGTMEDLTLALNWYLNPYTRVMLNYVHAALLGVGNADALLARVQVDF